MGLDATFGVHERSQPADRGRYESLHRMADQQLFKECAMRSRSSILARSASAFGSAFFFFRELSQIQFSRLPEGSSDSHARLS